MKTLIICVSVHHQNTEKIAQKMALVLGADIKNPEEISSQELLSYDVVGFGSGIYAFKHHRTILKLADNMSDMNGRYVFIFSTSGAKDGIKYHKTLRNKLIQKNCKILGEFNCLGWDSFGPFKLFGGFNKNRPNENDFLMAEKFAQGLIEKLRSS